MAESRDKPYQEPIGALIEDALKHLRPKLSQRKAAARAGMTDSWWRQMVNGATTINGKAVQVNAPPETLARMARAVEIIPDDIRAVGRPDVADALLRLIGEEAESQWHREMTPLGRLIAIRDELSAMIEQWPARDASSAPEIEVNPPDAAAGG